MIVVVGASFAGLSAAEVLARHGLKTIVIERSKEIGKPVRTTGGISRWWYEKLGLNLSKECIASEIRAVELYSPSGYCWRIDLGETLGYVLEPDATVKYLAKRAQDAGAEIHTNKEFVSLKDWDSKYIIGADGFCSRVAKEAGFNISVPKTDIHIGYEKRIECESDKTVRLWLGKDVATMGYAWQFCANNSIRVGLGIPISVGNIKRCFDKFMKDHPEFNGKVIGEGGGLIPTAQFVKNPVKGNVLLTGDASLLCDPMTGGGIHGAIISGREVAMAIVEGKPKSYPKRIRKLRRILWRRYKMKKVFCKLDDKDLDDIIMSASRYKVKSLNPYSEFMRLVGYLVWRKPSLTMKFMRIKHVIR